MPIETSETVEAIISTVVAAITPCARPPIEISETSNQFVPGMCVTPMRRITTPPADILG